MLANGITLTADGQELNELKKVPEIGIDPEKVENTVLTDKIKKYELGIGDAGELEYTFKFLNTPKSSYRILKEKEKAGKPVKFVQTYPDKTTVTFSGQIALKIGSGEVNGVIDFTLKVGLQSEIEIADGTASDDEE